jgi:hypothetical protein
MCAIGKVSPQFRSAKGESVLSSQRIVVLNCGDGVDGARTGISVSRVPRWRSLKHHHRKERRPHHHRNTDDKLGVPTRIGSRRSVVSKGMAKVFVDGF